MHFGFVILLALSATLTGGVQVPGTSPSFVDLEGRSHQPLRVVGVKAHVLFFVTHDCPIANSYAPEITAIAKEYAGKSLRFYVVQVDPDLTPPEARKHATAYGHHVPILLDSRHQLVKATEVRVVPEVAVVLPDGTLAYRGRLTTCTLRWARNARPPRGGTCARPWPPCWRGSPWIRRGRRQSAVPFRSCVDGGSEVGFHGCPAD